MKSLVREMRVSVCCITYNHHLYITQALDSFLMQETDFDYEIIVGDDGSTDGTREIIEGYCRKYPGRIQLISHNPNIGAINNQVDILKRASGRYIAMCDGDDFWTDKTKLQKQAEFLDGHADYVLCCHHTRVIDDNDNTVYEKKDPVSLEFDYKDVLLGKREETRICSLMMRNIEAIMGVTKHHWYFETHGTDTLLKLYALASTGKKIYVMPEVMACYRLHTGGIWSMINPKLRKTRMLSDFNLTIRNFKYSSVQKRALLKIYLKQYFLFDMRYLNFNSAVQTLTALW
ncbi:glycosyltransferase [Pedobacter sp. MC2016-24]|uniref:glycosyltransferase n=1 Tax=Pedobacter sp. MC2016-24 TaxID=2780090 RepID=UPI0018829E31|nr:glycosyltransferase [Pedobacter sp. MC2016-24]MBE9601652.1 glycosyltransferase [Pedobacter sp. MC2016-24]